MLNRQYLERRLKPTFLLSCRWFSLAALHHGQIKTGGEEEEDEERGRREEHEEKPEKNRSR